MKEISAVSDKRIKEAIEQAIINIESARSIREIQNLKKLKVEIDAYRIRIGDYRMGIYIDGKQVVLARFLHRKEIYRYFP